MLFGVKTTIGQEILIAEMLEAKIHREKEDILSITIIPGIRGYLLIEAENETEIKKLLYKAPHVRGLIGGEVRLDEIAHFFEMKSMTQGVERGDIVEITSGAFKGEKARVIRIDSSKDKITVEIIEAAVPIPVTVDAASIRVLQRRDEAGKKEEDKHGRENN